MYRLSAVERETIFLFNEAEGTAEIEAHNPALKKRLAAIRRERPEDISLVRQDGYADTYSFPKKWIKIIPPRTATEKQREHLAKARNRINS